MLKRVAVSGYKPHELGVFNEENPGVRIIKKVLETQFRMLLDEGLEWIITSGQPGVEFWAAEVVLDLQEEFPHLKYAVMPPFLEQEKNWNETRKAQYEMITMHADFFRPLTKRPYEAPWQFVEKNRFLLRNTDALLLMFDEETGGSPKFIKEEADRFKDANDYQLFFITPDDLRIAAEEEQSDFW